MLVNQTYCKNFEIYSLKKKNCFCFEHSCMCAFTFKPEHVWRQHLQVKHLQLVKVETCLFLLAYYFNKNNSSKKMDENLKSSSENQIPEPSDWELWCYECCAVKPLTTKKQNGEKGCFIELGLLKCSFRDDNSIWQKGECPVWLFVSGKREFVLNADQERKWASCSFRAIVLKLVCFVPWAWDWVTMTFKNQIPLIAQVSLCGALTITFSWAQKAQVSTQISHDSSRKVLHYHWEAKVIKCLLAADETVIFHVTHTDAEPDEVVMKQRPSWLDYVSLKTKNLPAEHQLEDDVLYRAEVTGSSVRQAPRWWMALRATHAQSAVALTTEKRPLQAKK